MRSPSTPCIQRGRPASIRWTRAVRRRTPGLANMVHGGGGVGSTFTGASGGGGGGGDGSAAIAIGSGPGACATLAAHEGTNREVFATARVIQERCQGRCQGRCIERLSHAGPAGANKGSIARHSAAVTSSLFAAPSKMTTEGS